MLACFHFSELKQYSLQVQIQGPDKIEYVPALDKKTPGGNCKQHTVIRWAVNQVRSGHKCRR